MTAIFGVSVLVSLLVHLIPGDPVALCLAIVAIEPTAGIGA